MKNLSDFEALKLNKVQMFMKTILYVFSSFFFCLSLQSQEKQNVTVILHLDDELSRIEQKVYITSYCPWISGGERAIWDSVQTRKGQNILKIRGYAPFENEFKIIFSKEGPTKLAVLALPEDTVELDVTHKDNSYKTLYKKATKGKIHNHIAEIKNKEQEYWNKKHLLQEENNADSIASFDKFMTEFYCHQIQQTEHPMLANQCMVMLRLFFTKQIGKETIQTMRENMAKKFPNDPRTSLEYGSDNRQTERGFQTTQRLTEIEKERLNYQRNKQTNAIGSTLNLNLYGINGEKTSLAGLNNKYTYVDIWASWCKPCLAQFSYIKEALGKYPEEIQIYAISIDYNHNLWKKAIEKDSLQNFIHVIGTDNNRKILKEVEDLGVERIPKSFLLDKNRKIIAKDLHDGRLLEVLDSLIIK